MSVKAAIDNTKMFKSHHLNKGKLHLNRKRSKLLTDVFLGSCLRFSVNNKMIFQV